MTNELNNIERWDIFELALTGPSDGNPFLDVKLSAQFSYQNRVIEPDGFYDGDGVYRVRFMPDTLGEWHYVTNSNVAELDGQTGAFTCVAPSAENHGPVRVKDTFHFAYADGTPYYPFGTTCYAWAHQGDALEEQTLQTLQTAPFNKLRMCVFPKDYIYNLNEPVHYPFERDEDGVSDFTRFNPTFFQHFEQPVGQLRDMGIEADIIIFHPYDRWGYCDMDAEGDYRYLRYLAARLSAYRNIWWSKGGVLHGESWRRIAFMREIIEDMPAGGLTPMEGSWMWTRVSGGINGDYRLIYFGEHQPVEWAVGLPMEDGEYEIDVIDVWNMTITPIEKAALPMTHVARKKKSDVIVPKPKPQAAFGVKLPGKPYLALRVRPKK